MGARVLVVEDNQENLVLIRLLLEAFGHTPILTSSGPEGIKVARTERPDIVLMDLQMPEMDGFEALRIMRDDPANVDLPIIAFTALATAGDREAGLAAGFDGYVTKPLDPIVLADELDRVLPPELHSRRPTVR